MEKIRCVGQRGVKCGINLHPCSHRESFEGDNLCDQNRLGVLVYKDQCRGLSRVIEIFSSLKRPQHQTPAPSPVNK